MKHPDFIDWSSKAWRKCGPSYILTFNLICNQERMRITVTLGKILPTNDGRWAWFRKGANHFFELIERQRPYQGVCLTLSEAMRKAEEDLECFSSVKSTRSATAEMRPSAGDTE